jgi:hypothetical protein
MLMEIIRQLRLIVAKLRETYSCQFIMDSESVLSYSKDDSIDLTEEAIQLLNSITKEDTPLESLEQARAAA